MAEETIRCDACPVLCYIKRGMAGACDRYANHDGQLVRVDPQVVLDRAKSDGNRRGDDVSRLQTCAVYRFLRSGRRGHGHGGDRRNFQLLRRESKN
jgi:hypothetical protein